MNERIKKLAEHAKKYALDTMIKIADKEEALKVYAESYDTKFAELIIQDCVQVCKQEWYDLNNAPAVADESERDIRFRSGEKVGVINCINKINQHFEGKL